MTLQQYRQKRDFSRTPEPAQDAATDVQNDRPRFVVQKHDASRLHYDFRLELDGVLKSWAVPKGPSLDPRVSALAVHVEDHPLEYAGFEGIIPQGQYGGGTVMVWDQGVWEPEGDPAAGYRRGKLKFRLHGKKLEGRWVLVQMHGDAGEEGKNWLLKKVKDRHSRSAKSFDILRASSQSVISGRSLEEIATEADAEWSSRDGTSSRPPAKRPARRSRANGKPGKLPAPAKVRHAVKSALPETIKPQLATLVDKPPEGDDWLHELKYDGYRLLSHLDKGGVRLLTRRGNDWTERFPTVAAACRNVAAEGSILDGEVVVLARDGTTDFQALQNLMRRGRDDDVVYYVFDLPYYRGYDLTRTPLVERKRVLAQLLETLPEQGVIRYSDHIVGRGPEVVSHACQKSLEGIVSKRADSRYEQRRSGHWVKIKCLKRQEFVVGGWTDPSGSRVAFGSLLLGHYDGSDLVYNGRVGTGFNQQSLKTVKRELEKVASKTPAFVNPPTGGDARGVHWTKPELVVEVQFTDWTADGVLRHPSFLGLREDKEATAVNRETPMKTAKAEKNRGRATKAENTRKASPVVAGVRLSHPERVVYPDQGLTKQDLAEYYVQVADWILPHVVDRPLTLVRCPQGRTQQCFYQKHVTQTLPPPVGGIEVAEGKGTALYVAINDVAGLVTLVQFGMMELHPWGSRRDKLEKPDRMIFDLDPGEGVAWGTVKSAAKELRDRLSALGLESFLRTTGGKGLHVVSPLARRTSWDQLKAFSKSVAFAMSHDAPDTYLATASKAQRAGKIYVDYLRNSRGATAVASFSTRARAGAPVATPLRWDELDALKSGAAYDVTNIDARLAKLKGDPWEGFFDSRQSLTKAMVNRMAASRR